MWSIERAAGTRLGWAGIPAVLFAFLVGTFPLTHPGNACGEEIGQDSNRLRTALDIGGALQVEFMAERGLVYTVEGQATEGEWLAIYGPVYGSGATVTDFVPGGGGSIAYRLKVERLADLGRAPQGVEGRTYALNYGANAVGFLFATADLGVATGQDGTSRGFAYHYEKSRPDVAGLHLEFQDGSVETITMTFWRGRVGTFESSIPREGRRPRSVAGTFRAGGDVSPQPALPLSSIRGSSFIFRDRGMAVGLEFTTGISGRLVFPGVDEPVRYRYDASAWPEASILITLDGSDESHEYTLNFAVRNSGAFVRKVRQGGQLKDTDRGHFSAAGADREHDHDDDDDDGEPRRETERRCLAPDSLEGTTLRVTIDGETVTIVITGANSGGILRRRSNGVSLQPFSYTYSKESHTEGLLTITLPGGESDEVRVLELDFKTTSSGKAVRKCYEDGELDDTDEGTFTLDHHRDGDD